METIRTAILSVSLLTVGVMAGLFFAYSNSVMPALRHSDDHTFVEAMQKINVAILNGRFFLFFIGALIATIIAAAVHLGGGSRRVLPWVLVALVLYLAVIVITGTVNVPLNNKLNDAGDVNKITNLSAVRESFELVWVRWNIARTVCSIGAFVALIGALIVQLKK